MVLLRQPLSLYDYCNCLHKLWAPKYQFHLFVLQILLLSFSYILEVVRACEFIKQLPRHTALGIPTLFALLFSAWYLQLCLTVGSSLRLANSHHTILFVHTGWANLDSATLSG